MTRHTSAIRPPVVAGLLVLLVTSSILAAEPRPSPSRYVPADGLVALVEYDGLDAHATAWEATAARGLLRDTPAGSMLVDLATEVLDHALKGLPGAARKGADVVALHEHIVRNGFAMAVNETPSSRAANVLFVFNGLGRAGMRERVERWIRTSIFSRRAKLPQPNMVVGCPVYMVGSGERDNTFLDPAATPPLRPNEPARPAGWPLDPWFSIWFEGEDVCLVLGRGDVVVDPEFLGLKKGPYPWTHFEVVARVIQTIDGIRPNAVSHPGRIAALAEDGDLPGFEGNGLLVIEPGRNGRRVLEELTHSFAPHQDQADQEVPPAPGPARGGVDEPPPAPARGGVMSRRARSRRCPARTLSTSAPTATSRSRCHGRCARRRSSEAFPSPIRA